MSLRTAWHTVAGLALCQLEGPRYAFDLPSFRKLIVDCTELTAPTEDHPEGTIVIKGVAPRKKSEWSDSWSITIDRKTGVIDDASWWYLTPKHGDGEKWGFVAAFVGLPGIVLCLPVLLPWWGIRKLLFKATGLDVHQEALFIKLRPQLPTEVQVPFLKALRKQNTNAVWAYRADKSRRRKERESDGKADAG